MSTVHEIMMEFSSLTGLSPTAKTPKRYLWTDAFAVCNFLGLYKQTGDEAYRDLALRLVDQVHHVLGRHREEDNRRGWISGLSEEEGRRHPTAGGLRIGKGMSERGPGEPYDERLEWERDGQYYHYLTKWMHALDRVTRVTGDPVYNVWAMELAKAVHGRFSYADRPGGRKRLYWKMSIDLSYPLETSMGQHDPLDGLITYIQIQATASRRPEYASQDLCREIVEMEEICRGMNLATDDPLGIGGLLSDAYRLAQLIVHEKIEHGPLLDEMIHSSLAGLNAYGKSGFVKLPVRYRLAFRELGLTVGLHAVERLREIKNMGMKAASLMPFVPLAEAIEEFWIKPENRRVETWTEHREINMVMLATSLAPDGYVNL